MLYFFTLAVITLSISLAIYGLARQFARQADATEEEIAFLEAAIAAEEAEASALKSEPANSVQTDLATGIPLEPTAPDDAETLDGFDPETEAVVVQVPAEDLEGHGPEDVATRPGPDGKGQDILFRDRVLLHLPDVPVGRKVDIYIEPIPA